MPIFARGKSAISGAHFVEVADDLVEEPEALEALLVDVVLVVELLVVGDRGEHHCAGFVSLTVQFLRGVQMYVVSNTHPRETSRPKSGNTYIIYADGNYCIQFCLHNTPSLLKLGVNLFTFL